MTTRHSERRFARHLENIPQVFCEVVESNESSQQMTTRHTGCRFSRKYTSGHFTLVGGPCLLLQIDIRYDGSSFAVTSRSIRVESLTFATLYSLQYSDDRLPVVSRFKNVEGSCYHVLVPWHSFSLTAHVRAPRLPVC